MREPLLITMIAVAAGIVAGRLLGFSTTEAALPAAALAALSAVPVSGWLRRTTLALAFLFTGAFLWAWHLPTRHPWIDAGSRETVTVTGCVVEPAIFSDDRSHFTLELEK